MASMLSKKARVKITNITDSYSYSQYRADNKQFVPLFTIDKEGRLQVISDSFDNEIPRDHKLVALVIEDEVQPKEVDVTEKQNQARALANSQFEATSKPPEKRKEKTITEGVEEPGHGLDINKAESKPVNPLIKAPDAQISEDITSGESEAKPSTTASTIVPTTQLEAELATKLEQSLQKHSDNNASNGSSGVNGNTNKMSGNKGSKPASVKNLQSQDNGNSQAPRQADGSLDPQRLPDTEAKINSDKSS